VLLRLRRRVLLGDLARRAGRRDLVVETERLVDGRLPRALVEPLGLGPVGPCAGHRRGRREPVEDGPRELGAGRGELRRGLGDLAGGLVEGEAVALSAVGVEAERREALAARPGEGGLAG